VGNALKFTEKGYVRICVTKASSPPDGSVQFLVQDSGPGIAPGTLDRLFMPFTQGDSSMSRKHGGTGLGLSIARRLVELMNGSIYAKSVIGQGSEFGFTLPLSSAGPVVSAPAQDEPRAASTWAIDESGRRRPA
jgi:signal transduction histidine kinase